MRGSRRRDSGMGLGVGVILLVVGGALLLRNIGMVAFEWSVMWPLIVIAAGLVLLAGALRGPGVRSGLASVTVPRDGARRLELELRVGAGRYRLVGGSAGLVEVSASDPVIEHSVDRAGDLARVRLAPSVRPWSWGWGERIDWRIGVAADVPTALDVRAGAGEFDLDLSSVAVASATVSIGAARLRLVLPRPRGDLPIRVEGGAAQLDFEIPSGVEARVATSGLVTTSGRQETPGYASATDRVTVSVTGGAAAVSVGPAR